MELQLKLGDNVHLRILADEHKLVQVVRNLVSNGLKFTPAGGRVIVSVAYLAAEEHAVKGLLKVSVTDTGAGISQVCVS
jgi:signal transduction histidine kinase